MNNLGITVIVSTYNKEEWLQKVLEGYKYQTYDNFEVLVADDGSRPETKELIDSFKADYPVPLRHIWHEDDGYRRQRILNIAITEANKPYILFTDGDCIPRKDFIEVHAKYAEEGYFLSGGYCKLPMKTSEIIDDEAIKTENAFNVAWLKQQDKLKGTQALKLNSGNTLATFLDFITPTNASFNNCNSSAWKEDLIAINGYDERMQYGGPDRELGERLENYGLKPKQIRHKAIVLHLDHARGYKTKESLDRNLAIRKDVKDQNKKWTEHGIVKGEKGK
ncbi:glycosyltransferase family 2 protein [Rasiella sp. SM2506]|uniref:glycosyltransferase family 2 protein n=1 Tax=Rasiella sp. SM2506 TaxID=3423914 RepID=UPI003D798EA8